MGPCKVHYKRYKKEPQEAMVKKEKLKKKIHYGAAAKEDIVAYLQLNMPRFEENCVTFATRYSSK